MNPLNYIDSAGPSPGAWLILIIIFAILFIASRS